jgi:hypothetical protein
MSKAGILWRVLWTVLVGLSGAASTHAGCLREEIEKAEREFVLGVLRAEGVCAEVAQRVLETSEDAEAWGVICGRDWVPPEKNALRAEGEYCRCWGKVVVLEGEVGKKKAEMEKRVKEGRDCTGAEVEEVRGLLEEVARAREKAEKEEGPGVIAMFRKLFVFVKNSIIDKLDKIDDCVKKVWANEVKLYRLEKEVEDVEYAAMESGEESFKETCRQIEEVRRRLEDVKEFREGIKKQEDIREGRGVFQRCLRVTFVGRR